MSGVSRVGDPASGFIKTQFGERWLGGHNPGARALGPDVSWNFKLLLEVRELSSEQPSAEITL